MTEAEIEEGIRKKLRMNGLVNSNLEVIRHMDREIETAQSRYYLIKTQGPGEGQRMDFQLMSSPFSLVSVFPISWKRAASFTVSGYWCLRADSSESRRCS